VSGVFENLPAHRLVEDAIAMNIGAFQRHGVRVERKFSPVPLVRVDRHKVLQILINLLRNAKYALDEVTRTDKCITISVFAVNEQFVHIVVADNGIGISPENLTRIFAHGFTTREEGHGFGLHSGALAARAMGGSLSVASDGIGRGAAFTLELPIAPLTNT
jgi:C4-dicarboxylate-specific signal transduction histidine kinase